MKTMSISNKHVISRHVASHRALALHINQRNQTSFMAWRIIAAGRKKAWKTLANAQNEAA